MAAVLPDDAVEISFIGNATTLIRYGELTLLTDPNFLHRGDHAYLGHGLFARRLTEPALDVRDLPGDLDAVVLSHLHGDHWDRVARRHLDRSLPVLTTPHAARRLRVRDGFRRAGGLPTWHSHTLVRGAGQVRVTALPGRHALGPLRRLLPPVMGSLLEFGPVRGPVRLRLYVSGDTLLFDGLDEIARRYPDITLAVLHLGGTTLPGGWMVTMDGAQGAELVDRLRPRLTLPVHYDDYSVFRSPLSAFLTEAQRRGWARTVVRCERGRRARVTAGAEVHVG
ncbi:MBL fold metallo-hydrolase [Streptomyces glaucus]|uniref:MBL fold metallo-hydrolase n=1 Tax=Streptomyces glaucus TaxID=284029 RepID=A0ABP5X2K7_9ACTN